MPAYSEVTTRDTRGPSMTKRVPRRDYPWWVKLGLWGVPSRVGAWAFVAVSLLAALAFAGYAASTGDVRFYWGLLFLLSALMYWLSIRWVDQYGSWDAGPSGE